MITLDEPISAKELRSGVKPVWCPGCGDFGVLTAMQRALSELQLDPAHVVVASGIGCSGRFPAYLNVYGFHGVHGRSLPLATGVKVANPDLTVFAVGGDGDAFSIGAGHVPHAVRRNVDISYIVMDNSIYGMTKGQPSPTSPLGMERKASPYGTIDAPLNPILMLLAYGATFVARGFSAQPKELTELIKQATLHQGFSFLQVLSPCVTFFDSYDAFKEMAVSIPEDHDNTDRKAAIELAMETDRYYCGIFYQEDRPAHHERVQSVRERSGGGFSLEDVFERFRR